MRFSAWISVALSALWMIGGTGYFWLKDGQEGLQFATDLYYRRSNCISEDAMLRYRRGISVAKWLRQAAQRVVYRGLNLCQVEPRPALQSATVPWISGPA